MFTLFSILKWFEKWIDWIYNFLSSQEQKGNAFERHLLRDFLTTFCSSPHDAIFRNHIGKFHHGCRKVGKCRKKSENVGKSRENVGKSRKTIEKRHIFRRFSDVPPPWWKFTTLAMQIYFLCIWWDIPALEVETLDEFWLFRWLFLQCTHGHRFNPILPTSHIYVAPPTLGRRPARWRPCWLRSI